MKRFIKTVRISSILLLFMPAVLTAQQDSTYWNLRNCIDYALKNNISVKQARIKPQLTETNYQQARSALFPSLNASMSESYTHQKDLQPATGTTSSEQSYTGNYSLRSDVTLFNGFKVQNNIRQQQLYLQSDELSVKVEENNIEIAVTQAYLQILSAGEALKQAQQTLESTEALLERTKNLWEAGSLAESDYAAIKSQYSSDKYNLVVARNAFEQSLINIKLLLEIDVSTPFQLYIPDIGDQQATTLLPDKNSVFQTSLKVMPEISISNTGIRTAELDYNMARADYFPTLSLNAGISSGYSSINKDIYVTQLDNNFYQNAGLTLTIPIFNKWQAHQ
ncbi:MAG: TolC family protein, partial [Bacteroidetes bacterium]|nr:TolC family protein [Bacteroidota bacterium]